MYIYIHVYIYTYIYIYIYICMYACVCVCVCMYFFFKKIQSTQIDQESNAQSRASTNKAIPMMSSDFVLITLRPMPTI